MPSPPTGDGYNLSFRTVRLPFGNLRMTALLEACARAKEQEVMEALAAASAAGGLELELSTVDDWAGSSPLHWAAYAGSAESIDVLVKYGAVPSVTNAIDGSQPLHLAARYGRPAAAHALLTRAHSCVLSGLVRVSHVRLRAS